MLLCLFFTENSIRDAGPAAAELYGPLSLSVVSQREEGEGKEDGDKERFIYPHKI